MDQRNKIGNAYVSEKGSHRQLSDIVYADNMAKALLERPRPPNPNVPTHFNGKLIKDLSPSEKEEFYISMQPASTQAVLRRDPKDDAKHFARPIPLTWKAVPDADMSTPEGRDRATGKRNLDPLDISNYLAAKNGKNTLGDSKESGTTAEKKEKAVWAYTYSKPAELTAAERAKVTKIDSLENAFIQPDIMKDEKPKRAWAIEILDAAFVAAGSVIYAIDDWIMGWGREDRD